VGAAPWRWPPSQSFVACLVLFCRWAVVNYASMIAKTEKNATCTFCPGAPHPPPPRARAGGPPRARAKPCTRRAGERRVIWPWIDVLDLHQGMPAARPPHHRHKEPAARARNQRKDARLLHRRSGGHLAIVASTFTGVSIAPAQTKEAGRPRAGSSPPPEKSPGVRHKSYPRPRPQSRPPQNKTAPAERLTPIKYTTTLQGCKSYDCTTFP